MGMIGYVGLAGYDGDALKARQGDGEGDANIGSHPEEALGCRESCHVDRLLAVPQVACCQHTSHVGCNVNVLGLEFQSV